MHTSTVTVYKHINRFNRTGYVIHSFNHLNTELNPICHLLGLLGDRHILHVSRIRVNIRKFRFSPTRCIYLLYLRHNKPRILPYVT